MRRQAVGILRVVVAAGALAVMLAMLAFALFGRKAAGPGGAPASPATAAAPEPASSEDDEEVRAVSSRVGSRTAWNEGLAAVVLVDVSGSMRDRVRDENGQRHRKLDIAKRAAIGVVEAFEKHALAHPGQPVMVGVYEFSSRGRQPSARVVVAPGRPESESARQAIQAMKADGGTPIGDAMVEARLALDTTGLGRRHLIVLTDGENTDGLAPAVATRAFEAQPEAARASLYFIAFDVDARAFAAVRDAGALLLPARDGVELAATFDELLSDRILVEAPRAPIEKPRQP